MRKKQDCGRPTTWISWGIRLSMFFCLTLSCLVAVADGVRFDFETGDLQGWQVAEGEFSKLVGNRDVEFHNESRKYTKQGTYYLTTLERADSARPDDGPTGVIESPVFRLTGPKASMIVGGGSHPTTYVALCTEDGSEVLFARGRNSQTMQRVDWDVSPWVGKRVYLRLVDRHAGGWGHLVFDDFQAEGRIDPEATRARTEMRARSVVQARHRPLRTAIEHHAAIFKDRYPKAKEYLARLDDIEVRLAKAGGDELGELEAAMDALRREALLANPLVGGQPILFVVRSQYRSDHHNTATMFQKGEINEGSFQGGGALKMLDPATGRTTTLLELPEGIVRDPDVHFDGRRILVSIRKNKDDAYHIYELSADGSGLRQITFGSGISDIDPIYLPDDRVLFTSTREPKYCMCNRHIMGNLFTVNADGSNMDQIGHSTLHEGHAALLPDGRVIYDRWEYVDRNFGDAQGVWLTGPDGTNHAIYWGNNTNSPGGVLDTRPVPGTDWFLATFSSCHDRPWGALALVDRRLGIDGREPVLQTWPPDAIDLVGQGNYDTFRRVPIKYEDPYPLSDTTFLCSRMTGRGEEMGIYLVDRFGNEVAIHTEEPGCYDPMPLASRTRPPVIPSRTDLAKAEGRFYVENVYIGTGMDQVEPGTVKSLRIVESPEKRFWTGHGWDGGTGQQAPGMAWNDFNNKRIIGTVPVEADGSAYFSVPADTFLYFQLLDERGMMVQSMRSGTIVRPGEVIGCIGCHEDRRSTFVPRNTSKAMLRGPDSPKPWYGPTRLFSYTAEVQPVFDKHCTTCHDYGKQAGKVLNLAGDRNLVFNTSYTELRAKDYVHVVGAGPHPVQMPMSWGSHASRLAKVLLGGHGNPEIDQQVRLDAEAFGRIITWMDINAPYYPDYASAYRDHPYGRSPITQTELDRLAELTGANLKDRWKHGLVNFGRPELSACLALLEPNDPRREEALTIIRAGQTRLAKRPRADMPEFRLVAPVEIAQQEKYDSLMAARAAMQAAIARGERLYPPERDIPSKEPSQP